MNEHCVHGICRSGSTYCGDGYCDSPTENNNNCPADCQASGGGGLPPTPPVTPPPTEPLPPVPPVWPPVIQPPIPGQYFKVPPAGISILLMGNLTDGRPNNGTVGILLYYRTNDSAIINNLTAITPENLSCGQVALAGYEINITADIVRYCMNYEGIIDGVNASTLSVWQFSNGTWIELPAEQVLHDTDVICANITSARTPYMIAGFAPIIGTTSEIALAAIQNANRTMINAQLAGMDVTLAQDLLVKAITAYKNCDYESAKNYAEAAAAAASGLQVWPILLAALIIGAGITGYLVWRKFRKRLRPSIRQPETVEPVSKMEPVHARHVRKLARAKTAHVKHQAKHRRK
jgi:hypothetical protein